MPDPILQTGSALMLGSGIKAQHTLRMAPVGLCIYCGAADGRLTDEHIIPKGLGGTLVLPRASCDACARLTSQFEMRVLRGFLDRGRQAMGIKGRKSHKRGVPDTVAQTFIQVDDLAVEHEVPWDKGVKVMHLPVFTPPSFLDARTRMDPHAQDLKLVAVNTATFGLRHGEIVCDYPVLGIRFEDRLDLWAFVKMLAKIAHSYHVAIHGLFPLKESPLVPIIMGMRLDARNWIGNTEHEPLPSDRPALHLLQHLQLDANAGSHGMAVRIKLFAPQQAPTYTLATRLYAQPGLD